MQYYEPITTDRVVQVFTDLLFGRMASPADDDGVDLLAVRRTTEQVERLVRISPLYNKILDGYPYYIYLEGTVLTGSEGVRHLYKAMLLEGMTEQQIAQVIWVQIGEKEYPLNGLKITNHNDRNKI